MPGDATAVVVAYGVTTLDLDWIPEHAAVVVVHNDALLPHTAVRNSRVIHVEAGRNIGFGAGVNLGFAHVRTERVVLVNPDIAASPGHWAALAGGADDEITTVPLLDASGRPTSVINAYPSPATLLAGGLRLGRLAPRGQRLRNAAARALGRAGRAHAQLLGDPVGRYPLPEMWASGALVSVSTQRFRAVGGFDHRFLLYYEDMDLCRRLGAAFPEMHVVCAPVPAAQHVVGRSGTAQPRSVASLRLASARLVAAGRQGVGWRACEAILATRARGLPPPVLPSA